MGAKKHKTKPGRPSRILAWGGAVAVIGALIGLALWKPPAKRAVEPGAGTGLRFERFAVEAAAYAGSASCRDCHREAYDQWQGSHHALAERSILPAQDQ